MFSNTALAHRLERTHDWVVIYFHLPHEAEGHATVVTERAGNLRGQRVVRGRERESGVHWTDQLQRAS
jgi:putative hydrolase